MILLTLFMLKKWVYFVRLLLHDKIAKFHWNLVIVYGDAQNDGKAYFLAELSRIYQDNPLPCVIGGDFNLLRGAIDKSKTSGW